MANSDTEELKMGSLDGFYSLGYALVLYLLICIYIYIYKVYMYIYIHKVEDNSLMDSSGIVGRVRWRSGKDVNIV